MFPDSHSHVRSHTPPPPPHKHLAGNWRWVRIMGVTKSSLRPAHKASKAHRVATKKQNQVAFAYMHCGSRQREGEREKERESAYMHCGSRHLRATWRPFRCSAVTLASRRFTCQGSLCCIPTLSVSSLHYSSPSVMLEFFCDCVCEAERWNAVPLCQTRHTCEVDVIVSMASMPSMSH
jgi:hypothetical protein